MQLLKLQQINKVFNEATPDEKIALDQINLHLKKGDFVTVIGSNGAGKSTMMNMISGALTPDFGVIEIAGKNVVKLPEYKRSGMIGRVFQDPMAGTAPSMTIEENLQWLIRAIKHADCGKVFTRNAVNYSGNHLKHFI